MLYRVLVPICSGNVGGKLCLAGVETLAWSPACRMDTRETPDAQAAEAAAPTQRESRDTCALATQRTFLNGFSTDRHVLPSITQKERGHM